MHMKLTDSNYELALLCSTCFIQIVLGGTEKPLNVYSLYQVKKKERKKEEGEIWS